MGLIGALAHNLPGQWLQPCLAPFNNTPRPEAAPPRSCLLTSAIGTPFAHPDTDGDFKERLARPGTAFPVILGEG